MSAYGSDRKIPEWEERLAQRLAGGIPSAATSSGGGATSLATSAASGPANPGSESSLSVSWQLLMLQERVDQQLKQQGEQVDRQLQQQWDLIPRLIEERWSMLQARLAEVEARTGVHRPGPGMMAPGPGIAATGMGVGAQRAEAQRLIEDQQRRVDSLDSEFRKVVEAFAETNRIVTAMQYHTHELPGGDEGSEGPAEVDFGGHGGGGGGQQPGGHGARGQTPPAQMQAQMQAAENPNVLADALNQLQEQIWELQNAHAERGAYAEQDAGAGRGGSGGGTGNQPGLRPEEARALQNVSYMLSRQDGGGQDGGQHPGRQYSYAETGQLGHL